MRVIHYLTVVPGLLSSFYSYIMLRLCYWTSTPWKLGFTFTLQTSHNLSEVLFHTYAYAAGAIKT